MRNRKAFGPLDWLLAGTYLVGCVLAGFAGGLLLIGMVAR